MTDKNYPVPVPCDLVNRLTENSLLDRRDLVLRAYQEGANAELDACCEWLSPSFLTEMLRATRRPKPKSQAEEAIAELDGIATCFLAGFGGNLKCGNIRAALERLRELEGGND